MTNLSATRVAELSTLSNLAYTKTTLEPAFGWSDIDDYSIRDSNGFSATTYRRGNDFVIGFRGTDSIADVGADASFFFKQWNIQFEEAAKLVQRIRSENTNAKIYVTGHSLGGGIAQIMAKMFKLSGASFDAPGASAVTNTQGYLEAKARYASDVPESQGSGAFVNYLSSGSLISLVGQHVGDTQVLAPVGASFSSITVISFFALFAGGPITLISLAGLFIGNVSRTHPIAGMERAMWVNALLEEQLSLDRGNLVEVRTRRSDVPELLALGGNPNDEVSVFRDRFTNAVQATLTREAQGFVLRSGDMTEKVTLTQAADGAFDCKIERIDMPPTTCRLRFDPSGTPRVEIDRNGDGLPEQIVESGRDDSGWTYQKTSLVDRTGRVQASEAIHESDDGLQKLVWSDRNGDGLAEERRQVRLDGDAGELTSVARLDASGDVQSELLLRSDRGRQLTVYELIVNGQTENLGFISQPVDDALIARVQAALNGRPDLRGLYATDGVLTETITIDQRSVASLAWRVATQLVDLQLDAFASMADSDALGSFPSLLPSDLLTRRVSAELALFRDQSTVDIRVSDDHHLMLVSSDRMTLIRSDGSVRRQLVGEHRAQTIENLEADGYLESRVHAMSPDGTAGNRGIRYEFNYRDGASAQIDVALSAELGEFAALRLQSGELSIEASFAAGKLAGIQRAQIDGRELSPGALEGLAMQLSELSVDELQSAFAGLRAEGVLADDVSQPVQVLATSLHDLRNDLVEATDSVGQPIYLSRSERQLQTLTNGVASLIDGLSLLNALKTGQPVPVLASGLRLAAGVDMLDGSRDLPLLGGAASAASAVLSLYGLAQALKEGDGVAALSSATYATAGIAETAALLHKAGLLDTVPSSLSAAGNSLNAALPYINLVNSIAHGDKTGVAVAVADLALMKVVGAYTVPVIGWAYAVFSLVDALFTDIPDPWGHARFVWRDGSLAIEAAGETGGQEAVRQVMETVKASMEGLLERVRQQNPGSQLGLISNRMPGLAMAMDGYRFTDIDALTGAERHPELRFDTTGRPYNAEPGSPESYIGLVESIIRSALAREAIAPLWEVRTAQLQTAAGDPKAGLREEERAGSDGLLAAPVTGGTQIFRPVALDLDGDGIERISREQGVAFDIDSSGYRKRSGWIAADDAMLVFDRNYNGIIDSGREMFSNALVGLARRGLAGMAWVDANYDGRLTPDDPVWEELKLWRDLDSDAEQDDGELVSPASLGIDAFNYAMSTYRQDGQLRQMASPDLDADLHGVRAHLVPQGILIESTETRQLSLLVSRINDLTAVEPGRDGVDGIEDVELLIPAADLLTNDLLGGFSGRALALDALVGFRHGSGFIDANGIIHFQPEADHAGEGAGFDYAVRAANGQTAVGRVDVQLTPVNDAPVLGRVDQELRAIYGYRPLWTDPDTGEPGGALEPMYAPFTDTSEQGIIVHHDTPLATEASGIGWVIGADIDDPAGSLRYELLSQPQYGAVKLDVNGEYRYTSWKEPDIPSDRVLLDGQYAAWKDGMLYNRNNMHGHAVYSESDAFQVRITDPQGASTVATVTVAHYGPYLPPTPPGGGGKKPIAIDLDGDGFEFVNVDDSSIFFDVTGDGWKRRTSWVGADDGILAIDLDGDGKIDRPGEIAFADRVEGAQTDLEGMMAFDTDGNGRFDVRDRDWSRFGIWQDRNQNGLTDDGEYLPLDAIGVQAIHLDSDGRFQVIDGQTIHGLGRLEMIDGTARPLADVTLAFSQQRQLPATQQTQTPSSPFSPSGSRIGGGENDDLVPGQHGSDVIEVHGGDDLVFDDVGNDLVVAGDGNDLVFSGADHDFIDGGAGSDGLQSGLGDDTVFAGDGEDTVFLQQGNDIAFGGDGDDLLAGEAGNDVISGDVGGDQLFGGDGADALFGGYGDDALYGMDGGDLLDGGDGDDLLDGGAGADQLFGGAGNDRYLVDDPGDGVNEPDDDASSAQGIDTVLTTLDGYRIGERIENLELLDTRGSGSPRAGSGNALANRIVGNHLQNTLVAGAGDDLIDGGQGADLMIGGTGSDLYLVEDAGDRVIEQPGEGDDKIRASVSLRLPEHVEQLFLTGTDPLIGTGNALDNTLTGNSGNNLLDGGTGADRLIGGHGDDVYRVDNDLDQIIEQAGEGIDTVSSRLDWRLSDHVENLVLSGEGDLRGFGNALDNLLRGNRGSNLLSGGAGNDELVGDPGSDVLDGGEGSDVFVYRRGDGLDRVLDASGHDQLRLGAGITPDQLAIRLVAGADGPIARLRLLSADGEEMPYEGIDIAVKTDPCRQTAAVIEEVAFADGRRFAISDLLTTANRYDLHAKYTSLKGGQHDDILFGNSHDNQIDGGRGHDALFGKGGEDQLSGGAGNDFLAGGAKDDLLRTGTGYNLIAFNRNDGSDVIVSEKGAVNTLSLGKEIPTYDLALRRRSNDLILQVGKKDSITLQDWYQGTELRNLKTLQLIDSGHGKRKDPSVTQIDFAALVERFDAEASASARVSGWTLTEQRLTRHLATGTIAIGGELARDYALKDSLSLSNAAVADTLFRLDPAHAGQRLLSADSRYA